MRGSRLISMPGENLFAFRDFNTRSENLFLAINRIDIMHIFRRP